MSVKQEYYRQGVTFLSTVSLYQLHLPVDVLHSIPVLGLPSSNVDGAVEYHIEQDVLQTFFSFITLAYDCLVWAATSFVNYAVHAVGEGLKLLGQIVNGMATAIVQAAQKMADAFNAFVTWAVTFITDTLNVLFGPIIDGIKSLGDSYCSNVYSACVPAQSEIENGGAVSYRTTNDLIRTITGDLLIALVGIATIVMLALTILSVVTGPFGFLEGTVMDVMLSLIVVSAIGGMIATLSSELDLNEQISDFIASLYAGAGGSLSDWAYLSSAIDVFITLFECLGIGMIAVCPGMPELGSVGMEFALATAGLLMSFWSTTSTSGAGTLMFDVAALSMSGYALIKSGMTLSNVGHKIIDGLLKNNGQTMILGFAVAIAGTGAAKSTIALYVDVRG